MNISDAERIVTVFQNVKMKIVSTSKGLCPQTNEVFACDLAASMQNFSVAFLVFFILLQIHFLQCYMHELVCSPLRPLPALLAVAGVAGS